jgi:hypothetical protein
MPTKIERKRASFQHVMVDVLAERQRQDKKWGEQNHPSVDPVLQSRVGGCVPERMCREYEIPCEERAKYLCQTAAAHHECTWTHIALEEFCEAVSAPDDAARRGELVQLAAVVVQWIECLDRRAGK